MSLIDVATELEFVPEQELIELSQNPQSRYPQFLVLSEVQRRNQMRRMYENQVNKAEQPLTTVAEEKVMELAQSSAIPNVPSPMSNETNQSPRGLLGVASESAPMPEAMMMAGGGLVSLQQGRTTDYQESIERSLQPAQGGQRGVPSDDPRLYIPYFPVESGDKSRARRNVSPPNPALSDLEQAQMEQQLLRKSLASTDNFGETGTSQANISDGEPPKTKAEGTNVVQQIFDTSGQLGLPKVEIPRMTEEDKQRELGIYALGIMADAFGTGKNIGEAGAKLGKGVQGLLNIKRTQRQDDIKADSATRAQSVEEITLANTLYKTQLLADQYRKQGETNKVKALEILQEEIKEIKESTLGLNDETTKERIEKLQAQLDAELNRMFGTEALATYPGI